MQIKAEDLGGVTVFCSKTHRFGTDAVLLEHFAMSRSVKSACDMGTGCGIIPLLMLRDSDRVHVTAIDIQPQAVQLVMRAVDFNALDKRLTPLLADIRELDKSLCSAFELVTMNPPYKRVNAGLKSNDEGLNIARFELTCTMRDAAKAAAMLLKPGGRFCVCHRPERLCDLLYELRCAEIEPKKLQCVHSRLGTEPMLVLCEGVYKGNAGMKLLPPLYLENEQGGESEQLLKIYEKWNYARKGGNGNG